MKKIIYFALILVALVSCEKVEEIDLIYTTWLAENVEYTSEKIIAFTARNNGKIYEAGYIGRYSTGFTYEVNRGKVYIETEGYSVESYTGVVEGDKMTLQTSGGVEIYKKIE
ncbi:MAG: hypothetical protein PHV07_09645 [Oscillospiraceae bacterium]|nr:hypothetical protein [Oscillospiraceae bacterium]